MRTGFHWHPVRQLQEAITVVSGAELSHSELAVGATIGAQDTNLSSEDWRSGYRVPRFWQ
jgi:hypothetical protein